MAVKLEGGIKRFTGLSTDEKPGELDGSEIPPGSSFLETDTFRIARFADGRWHHDRPALDSSETLTEMLAELVKIRELLEMGL